MSVKTYRPSGYRDVTPYLVVSNADVLIGFLERAFGARTRSRTARPDRPGVMHAEIEIGDTVVEVSDGNERWPARPSSLHVFVPDADATYAAALGAGATSLYAVMDHPYGERSGGVVDPAGNHWFIATVVDADKRG